MNWTLVEPCAGSAAFTLHLLGARRALLPYQGSKWRYRFALQRRAEALGFRGAPASVALTDPGPWGTTLREVLHRDRREGVLHYLHRLAAEDPRAVYDRLQGAVAPRDATCFAAEHLFLQRLAFSGKAVGLADGRWASPGFNVTSAYGKASTVRFGEVKPMLPSLLRTLEGYHDLHKNHVHVRRAGAEKPTRRTGQRTLVYLDPPYARSTRYPNGVLGREEVLQLAEAWRRAGAAVIVSESEPLPLDGWKHERLHTGRDDTSPFKGKHAEWVTYSAAQREE